MDNRKTDNIRVFISQDYVDFIRCLVNIMPVQYFDIVIMLFQERADIIQTNGNHAHIFLMYSFFDEIRIDKKNLQKQITYPYFLRMKISQYPSFSSRTDSNS